MPSIWRDYHTAVSSGDLDKALRTAQHGIATYRRHDARHAGIWRRALANVLYLQGRYGEAVKQANLAVQYQPDLYEKGLSLVALGQMSTYAGDLTSAMQAFKEAANISTQFPQDIYFSTHLYGNRATAFKRLGEIDLAVIDFEGAAELFKMAGESWRAAMYINSIGVLLSEKGLFEEAEVRLLEALDLIEEKPHDSTLAIIYDSLGSLYAQTQRFHKGEKLIKKALRLFEKLGNTTNYIESLINLSKLNRYRSYHEIAAELATEAIACSLRIGSDALCRKAADELGHITRAQMHSDFARILDRLITR